MLYAAVVTSAAWQYDQQTSKFLFLWRLVTSFNFKYY